MKQLTPERIGEIYAICKQKQQVGEISWYVFGCVDDITDYLIGAVLDHEEITLNKRNFLRRFHRHFSPHELSCGRFAQAWAAIKQANKQAEATK